MLFTEKQKFISKAGVLYYQKDEMICNINVNISGKAISSYIFIASK